MSRKVVIVGGVAAGASCAARLRRLDEGAEIVLIERGPYVSFANCGLPYHVGNVVSDRDKLILQTPESLKARFNIDVRVNHRAVAIDRERKELVVEREGDTYREQYDALVLATGGHPVRPALLGVDAKGIFQLWNIPDMDAIEAYLAQRPVKSAVVVGGGFIGLEAAENLRRIGIDVTVVEKMNHVLPSFDWDMSQLIHRTLTENGVRLALNDGVTGFEKREEGRIVVSTERRALETDMVLLAIGVQPNSELAQAAGLKLGPRGHIIVSDRLRTSDPDIYAVGDVVEVEHFVDHGKTAIPLAGPANKMGRMAADIICGLDRAYDGTQGSNVVKLFGTMAAGTGLTQSQLEQAGKRINRDYRVTVLCPFSNATFYPDHQQFVLKVIFGVDGSLLGAQAVGTKGVDKRIDVIATAMRLGANVRDLERLELCYAPPVSSAKDPVNMAGYVAANILDGFVDDIVYDELAGLDRDVVYLDVRTPGEVAAGQIEGSLSIPVDELRQSLSKLDKQKEYVVYCAVGIRGYIASRIMKQNGFDRVRNLAGGYSLYRRLAQDYAL